MRKDARDPPDGADDAAAFAEAIRGVRKLGGARRVAPDLGPSDAAGAPARRQRSPSPSPSNRVETRAGERRAGDATLSVEEGTETWSARADGVDRRILRKLRDGGMPIEGRIDLHGLSRAKAAAALDRFVAASREAGRRCLLVIHGRGLHSGTEGPALRDVVRERLTAGAHAGAVLACASAPPPRGGAGATLVYLRR